MKTGKRQTKEAGRKDVREKMRSETDKVHVKGHTKKNCCAEVTQRDLVQQQQQPL